MATLPPKLKYLYLSSCNMKDFPRVSKDAENIKYVDLSYNQIDGVIPHWIGLVGRDSLSYLNLSHNSIQGGLEGLPWNVLNILDLRSNSLNGSLPSLICNTSSLEILILSYNNLSGVLPICSTDVSRLIVFDVRMNNIQGSLPSNLTNFRKCDNYDGTHEEKDEDDDYFLTGFTWEAVVIGYGCGVVPAFIIGYLMLLAGKPKFAGIIAKELGLKIKRLEIRMR
ncbi:hypothetical protein ACET3Z_005257 [Daucus carota]